jgi:hypothetical protein
MEDNTVPKRMLYGKPGRRRKTLVEVLRDVEKKLREIGARRLRTKAVDGNEWQRIFEET